MIDLKTIKNITISEGSVKKITNSSGVVLWQKPISSKLDVDLNNQWVASTKTLDGYKVYMSNSNKGVNNGYASMKFKFEGMPDFKIWINSYAESNYDYTIAWNLDVNYPTSNPQYNSTGVKAHTRGNQYDPTSISNFTEVDYPNDGGEHFVVVTYRKDSSANANDDRGYVAVKFTLLSTTWVVSATEFIKKNDKYYEKLTEVETYEGGITANTGNYKEGNELTVTYHQGSADDYMIVGSNKYYKNNVYVTPKDKEINTGDYIQGDLIGTISNTMKVKYVDGSIKEFTGLTTINKGTDPNKFNAKEVQLSEGITIINEDSFNQSTHLTDITISDTVTKIYSGAFSYCSSLTSITIPNSVTSINNSICYGCSNLTSVKLSDSLTSIGGQSFQNCTSLTDITIPNSVTSIGNWAFRGCSHLEVVTIQNSTSKLAYNTDAFANISSTAKLYVPSSLLSDYQADSNWTGAFGGGIFAIGEQVITNAMKVEYNYGTDMFTGLTSISENIIDEDNKEDADYITIYYGVTSIGDYAFENFINLMGVRSISYSVKTIGEGAFWRCSGLYDITLPYYVTSIGKWAFDGCSNLHYITVQASTPPSLGTDAIPSNVTTIYVPASSVNAYKSASGWKNFASKIKAIGS